VDCGNLVNFTPARRPGPYLTDFSLQTDGEQRTLLVVGEKQVEEKMGCGYLGPQIYFPVLSGNQPLRTPGKTNRCTSKEMA
jgi:hypothetical protein